MIRQEGRGRVPTGALALALAVVGGLWIPLGGHPGASGALAPRAVPGSAPTAPHGPGTAPVYAVGEAVLTLVDHSRRTPANGRAPGRPDRQLPTVVLYPATGRPRVGAALERSSPRPDAPPDRAAGPFGLVLFAGGIDSLPGDYVPLLQQWAAAGYVVAAPAFPLSSRDSPGGPTVADFAHQPGDLSFVLTQILARNRRPSSPLWRLVDPAQVAAVGHSLGAITVLGLVYNRCCQDRRIRAAAVFEPLAAPYGRSGYAWPPTPLLVLQGTADLTIGYTAGQTTFAEASRPKFFVSLIGAPHTSFLQVPHQDGTEPVWEPVDVAAVLDFLGAELGHDRSDLGRLRRQASVPGVASLVAEP